MKTCISMQPARLLCVNKILSVLLAFLILFFSLFFPSHEAHAAASSSLFSSDDITSVFSPAATAAYFYTNPDFTGNSIDLPHLDSYSDPVGAPLYGMRTWYETSIVPNFYSYSCTFSSVFNFTGLPSGKVRVTFGVNIMQLSYGFSFYDIISCSIFKGTSSFVFYPSSYVYSSTITSNGYPGVVGYAYFDFVVDSSLLSDSFVNINFSYPESSRYTGMYIGFDYQHPFTVTEFDSISAQAQATASAIANIGSGTPPADFSGSGSALNNLDDQLAVFDDTYKVDTGAVEDNFSDAMTFVESFELTQGMGVVGDLISRFTSDNPIWLSILIFSLAFGLSLFTIGRGLSVSGRRNNSKRGGSS